MMTILERAADGLCAAALFGRPFLLLETQRGCIDRHKSHLTASHHSRAEDEKDDDDQVGVKLWGPNCHLLFCLSAWLHCSSLECTAVRGGGHHTVGGTIKGDDRSAIGRRKHIVHEFELQ